jgi:RecA/RadA recombinase
VANKWLSKLQQIEGAVIDRSDPHKNVIRTTSPSLNYAFGKGHGLPRGYSWALGGFPKGGKTLITNMMVGQLHKDDPDAMVIKYNTELRETVQATPEELQNIWGFDLDRYQAYEVNSPMLIFDKIEQEVAAQCQAGMPLALVIIDSMDGVSGRRAMNSDTVETQQIGDWAQTIGDGLKRILPIQRKYRFAVLATVQIRAEMDMLEQKRGNKFKMKMPKSMEHWAEYHSFTEENRNVEGRTAMDGSEFRSEIKSGLDEKNGERTGHKIKVRLKESSCGPKGRLAEFTLDYSKGVVNTHEEVYKLAVNNGVIQKPNNVTHIFRDHEWRGKPAALQALADNVELRDEVMAQVYANDSNQNHNEDTEVETE